MTHNQISVNNETVCFVAARSLKKFVLEVRENKPQRHNTLVSRDTRDSTTTVSLTKNLFVAVRAPQLS